MSQNKTTLLSLALLLFLCFQAQAALSGSNSLRNPLHAPTSGIIDLKMDYWSNSFYVDADLADFLHSSNTTNFPVKMVVSLSNSETMVSTDCLNFFDYNCSQYGCQESSQKQTIDFPTFTANTKVAKGDVYLDYNYWRLSSSANLYIAQSCDSLNTSSTGYGRYGVLGLGTEGAAKDDFISPAIFSIHIESVLGKGTLLFKNDYMKYALTSIPENTLSANSNWQVPITGGNIKVGKGAIGFNGNLVFDINSDAIGLPYETYQSVLNDFKQYSGAYCSSDTYRPTCTTPGKIEDLPDITIVFNEVTLTIPSKIYATITKDSSFYLNFKATSPTMKGSSYVTPSFKDSIILDGNFMKYYYTVFDASSGANVISIYTAKETSKVLRWEIIAVVAGAILVAGLLFCCCRLKKKKNIETAQASLIYNQQGVGSNAYNFGG